MDVFDLDLDLNSLTWPREVMPLPSEGLRFQTAMEMKLVIVC